jgi:thiamine-phosphate pyrophosphorylase
MMKRQPLTMPHVPKIWLFSDERMENSLLQVAASLPVGSGVVLRHDGLGAAQRYHMLRRLMRMARERRLTVLLAGDAMLAKKWRAHGAHVRQRDARRGLAVAGAGLTSMPVHSREEALRARRLGAELVFISPLHSTRSHIGAAPLGVKAWLRLARNVGRGTQLAALGGMDDKAARALNRVSGSVRGEQRIAWAAIDALDRKCNARRAKRRMKPAD